MVSESSIDPTVFTGLDTPWFLSDKLVPAGAVLGLSLVTLDGEECVDCDLAFDTISSLGIRGMFSVSSSSSGTKSLIWLQVFDVKLSSNSFSSDPNTGVTSNLWKIPMSSSELTCKKKRNHELGNIKYLKPRCKVNLIYQLE